jgi:hypothetical protein
VAISLEIAHSGNIAALKFNNTRPPYSDCDSKVPKAFHGSSAGFSCEGLKKTFSRARMSIPPA